MQECYKCSLAVHQEFVVSYIKGVSPASYFNIAKNIWAVFMSIIYNCYDCTVLCRWRRRDFRRCRMQTGVVIRSSGKDWTSMDTWTPNPRAKPFIPRQQRSLYLTWKYRLTNKRAMRRICQVSLSLYKIMPGWQLHHIT